MPTLIICVLIGCFLGFITVFFQERKRKKLLDKEKTKRQEEIKEVIEAVKASESEK